MPFPSGQSVELVPATDGELRTRVQVFRAEMKPGMNDQPLQPAVLQHLVQQSVTVPPVVSWDEAGGTMLSE